MLAESMLLGACGGLAGLFLAFLFHRGLLALVAETLPIPRLDQVSLDLPVVILTLGLSLVTGLLFGLVPAIVSAHALNDAVREGGRHGGGPRARRVLSTLVAAEVALSLVLLAGAGLLVRSFIRLSSINPGFRADGLFTARVQLPGARYGTPERSSGFYSDFLARISALPGVQSAAGVTFLPLAAGGGIGTSFWRTDQPAPGPGQAPSTDVRPVTPGFFRTMGIPHVMGRDFAASDRDDSPAVAIVNETLVRQHLSDGNPLGKRLHVNVGRPERLDYEVVGVVGDIKLATLDAQVRPTVYLPHTQLALGVMTLVARTGMNPSSLTRSVGAELHAMDPELPLAEVRTMDEVVSATLVRPRVVTVLLTAFATMALALAAIGVYGVMAYSVAQRTREIGVRMALGATPRSVFELVLRQALRPVSIGVVAGLAAAAGLTRPLAALLYETKPLDVPTFIATAVVLLLVATMASYIPARRGTRIAPVEALRAE